MDWKFALAQHPMYLLIREDTQCAERTPPWGAPSIEDYNRRLEGNMDALRKFPQLKLGYEWSGYELELLAQDAPGIFRQMCELAHQGRTTFYNGTFAQPHLQTLSSEANIRQFEYGMEVYRRKCKHPVLVYAHQEASVHDQVPQLLAVFGIRYGIVPQFSSTLAWLDEGELVLFAEQGPRFVHGHEFVSWVGLDGTEVPLYLRQGNAPSNPEDLIANEMVAGFQHIPPIIVKDPDMIGIDETWVQRHAHVDLVLLEEALEERVKAFPPRARARLYSNWSYIEGIRAEELSRTNWDTEKQALQAEALEATAFLLMGRQAGNTRGIWRTILGLQHHDVYCFCAPELRGKAIERLRDACAQAGKIAADAADAVVSRIDFRCAAPQPLVLFNTTPHAIRTTVCLMAPTTQPAVKDRKGHALPSEIIQEDDGSTRICFVADMPGLGYQTLSVADDEAHVSLETPLKDTHIFENDWYRAEIAADGGFRSLMVKPSEEELLDRSQIANRLTATDTTGQSKREAGGPADLRNGTQFKPPLAGPALALETVKDTTKVRESPLRHTVLVHGRMGEAIKVDLEIHFYYDLPRIDIKWTFEFSTVSIGNFYDDYSKLKVEWPLAYAGAVYHDIAFGVIESRDERAIFPASWIDVSDERKGLAYFHTGTLKHWVSRNCLYNLFAWGENTDAIGGRLWRQNWSKAFDQRLRGRHIIRTALYPHAGDWRSANVVDVARSFGATPFAVLAEPHEGDLPTDSILMQIRDRNLAATSVRLDDNQVTCRVHALESPVNADALSTKTLDTPVLCSLKKKKVARLSPFQIGEFVFVRNA